VHAHTHTHTHTRTHTHTPHYTGVFPVVLTHLRSDEDSLKRECTYVLANPWALSVAVSYEVANTLLNLGVLQVCVAV